MVQYKANEAKIVKKLNEFNIYEDFKLVEDNEFSGFDAENNTHILELKFRKQHYPDQIFEEEKFHKNIAHAKATNREFIYIVRTTKGCYAWNISKLVEDGREFEWFMKMLPETTEFERVEWISKSVATLEYSEAKTFLL